MDAHTGANFLLQLLLGDQYPMDGDDLEEAIRIAGEKMPKSAFNEARRYYTLRHGNSTLNGSVGFAKGTRWLAMIRRDEGQMAFEKKVAELRQLCR